MTEIKRTAIRRGSYKRIVIKRTVIKKKSYKKEQLKNCSFASCARSVLVYRFIFAYTNLDHTLGHHCIGKLHETGNVGACNQVVTKAVFFSCSGCTVMDIDHDGL